MRRVFRGELWTLQNAAAGKYGLRAVARVEAKAGLGRDAVHLGGNSGYQSIGLAFLWGARRIVLLGFDMQHTGGASHWHGDHPWKRNAKPPVRNWVPRFTQLAEDLEREGVEVVNATRQTALKCFSVQPLEAALGSER